MQKHGKFYANVVVYFNFSLISECFSNVICMFYFSYNKVYRNIRILNLGKEDLLYLK
jgi:hypothetical protein